MLCPLNIDAQSRRSLVESDPQMDSLNPTQQTEKKATTIKQWQWRGSGMFQVFPGVLLPEVIVFLLQHEGGGTDGQTDSVPSYMLTSLQERGEQTGLPFSTKE